MYHLCSNREELVALMNKHYETLNMHFARFWSSHKQLHSCSSACSKAFVTDGFQKPSRFICGNVKTTIDNEELGKHTKFFHSD